MKNDAPMFGEFVRLVKTGEILRWKSYDCASQMVEIELSTGDITTRPRHEVERLTPGEELEFHRPGKVG